MDIHIGSTIQGENEQNLYEVIEFIGRGSFGDVFKVREKNSENIFALKTIQTSYLRNDELKALANEGLLATQILHPNVIHIFYFHNGYLYQYLPPYIIMEYASGGTLAGLINNRQHTEKPFSNSELLGMFTQLSEGMKAVNAKLVHRDIKPDNILVEKDMLMISDFGLAKVVGAATRSQTFKGMAHIRYASPEAWQSLPNTPLMDIYSMGIVFYEVATLKHPFLVSSARDEVQEWREAHLFTLPTAPEKHNSDLSPLLSQIIMKMLRKKPEDRYQNWDQILNRLRSSGKEETASIDVSDLLAKASRTIEERERVKLETERKRQAEEELNKFLRFRSEELKTALEEIVNEFNKNSDEIKLRITEQKSISSDIILMAISGSQGYLELKISSRTDNIRLKDKQIRAWGYLKASNGIGFNILLVKENDTDIYGKWYALHTKWSGFVREQHSPEPFAFEDLETLASELQLIGALHIYVFDVKIFTSAMLLPLFRSIL